ncbi:MAG: VOC family protein [Muribaculaceae bacterium]|nr:VOC family protein [Muribaculaceae bacterium]
MDFPLDFHHIGIACRDILKTQVFYVAMGYTPSPVVDDPLQHVRVCFLVKEGAPRLELLEPLNEQNPVARTLETAGVSPYHICYEVQDIDAAVAELRKQRFLLVNGPVVACAMDNRRVAFLFQKNTGLIELVEKTAR